MSKSFEEETNNPAVLEGLASVGILSLTEQLAEANCQLERYSQWEEHLQQEECDINDQLKKATTSLQKARQYRDSILRQLQHRIQQAHHTSSNNNIIHFHN